MDTAQLERDLDDEVNRETAERIHRINGPAQPSSLPLDRLEAEVVQVLDLRSKLKERCRNCAALIIEIERAL